jgi:hypothetical protein
MVDSLFCAGGGHLNMKDIKYDEVFHPIMVAFSAIIQISNE